jgi:hypothetical protein
MKLEVLDASYTTTITNQSVRKMPLKQLIALYNPNITKEETKHIPYREIYDGLQV